MGKKFVSMCLAVLMVFHLCGGAMAYGSSQDTTNAPVEMIQDENAYYIDSEGNKCYFHVEIIDDKIIVTDDFSQSVLEVTSGVLTTEILDTGVVTRTEVNTSDFVNDTQKKVRSETDGAKASSLYATVKFKPVIDSLGYTHNNSLQIYSDNLGTQRKQSYTFQSQAQVVTSSVLALLVGYFSGKMIAIVAVRLAIPLDTLAGSILSQLVQDGVTAVSNGIITKAFSTVLEATETKYEVQAKDPATNRWSRTYEGGKYVITEKGKYWNKTYYAGYYPQFVQNVNNSIRSDHAVAYWFYSDFWEGAFNGIA